MHITHLNTNNISQAFIAWSWLHNSTATCGCTKLFAEIIDVGTHSNKKNRFYGHYNKMNIASETEFNLIGSLIAARNSKRHLAKHTKKPIILCTIAIIERSAESLMRNLTCHKHIRGNDTLYTLVTRRCWLEGWWRRTTSSAAARYESQRFLNYPTSEHCMHS